MELEKQFVVLVFSREAKNTFPRNINTIWTLDLTTCELNPMWSMGLMQTEILTVIVGTIDIIGPIILKGKR